MPLPPFPSGPILTGRDDFAGQPLQEEELHRLTSARVVFARYDLLRHDFDLDGRSDREIDDWLIAHCGIVSQPQAAQTETNTRCPIGSGMRAAFRPPAYGRAAVVPVDRQPRLIDVKGIGVRPDKVPQRVKHRTGVLDATSALHEVLFEWLIAAVLQHTGARAEVVPTYGLLDLGFEAIGLDGEHQPAFAMARRAHVRPRSMWGDDPLAPEELAAATELVLLLRRYGILRDDGPFEICRRGHDIVLHAFGREYLFQGAEVERVTAMLRWNGEPLRIHVGSVQYASGMRQRPPAPQLIDFGGFLVSWEYPLPIYVATAYNFELVGEVVHLDDPRYPVAGPGRVSQIANEMPRRLAAAYARGARDGRSIMRDMQLLVEAWMRREGT